MSKNWQLANTQISGQRLLALSLQIHANFKKHNLNRFKQNPMPLLRKYHKLCLLLPILSLLTLKDLQAQTPTITSFSPTSGVVGTSVTLTGTNFNTTPTNNIVFLGLPVPR